MRQDLGKTFGTKKARKAINALTENAISTERGMAALANGAAQPTLDLDAAAILETMAGTQTNMATRDELQKTADENKPRPRANLAAEKLEEVYSLTDLMVPDAMKHINVSDWRQAFEEQKEATVDSHYIGHRLSKLRNVAASGEVMKKMKILKYMAVLFAFHNCLKGGGKEGKKVPPSPQLEKDLKAPKAIVEGVRRLFSSKAG